MSTATLIVLAGIALIVAYEVLHVFSRIRTAIRLGKEAKPFSRELSAGGKRVLVIGDSTSYGTGTTDPQRSLAGRLAADLPEHAIENLSENSMNLARLVEKLRVVDGPYTHTFIHIGGVDTLSFTPLSRVSASLREALTLARARTRGRVYLVSVNNPRSAPAYRFPLSRIFGKRSRKISALCDAESIAHGVYHVSLWQHPEVDPLRKAPGRVFAEDGTHPNDEGYGLWYQKIKEVL